MKRVLVIDDAKNIRLLLTKCLEIEGYEVKAATTGKEGLELLLSESFDLVFLDVKLPEMSGTEVLRRIRALGNTTPVIVITAYPTVKNAVECTKLQSITYLQKPFTADRLRAVLKEVTPPSETQKKTEIKERITSLIKANLFDEAIFHLKTWLSDEPMNPEIYFGLEKAYLGLGDKATAEKFHKAGESFQ